MDGYYIRQLLDPDEAAYILSTLGEDYISWRDGRETLGQLTPESSSWEDYAKFKINVEAIEPEHDLEHLREVIFNKLDCDREFLTGTAAASSTRPMFTKTNVGGYYSPHHDAPKNGHYSTTIFLSPKDEYDGGELCLFVNNKPEYIKLDPGWAITYQTGTPHCVTEVTRGTRAVSVFWTTSRIADPEYREWYCDIRRALNQLPQAPLDSQRSLDEAIVDPEFILKGLLNKMERKLTNEGRNPN